MNILDLFDKHLELVQEHETWIEYKCPLCNSNGLKIDKIKHSYKNFKCNCNTKKISAYLFSKSGEYKVERKPREPPIIIPEIPNVLGVRLSLISNPINDYDLNNKYNDLNKTITYPYSLTQRTLRINRIKSTGKKIVFPQVLVNNYWVNGIGDNIFPIFTNKLILKGNLIVIVEGEKCVEYVHCKKVEAMSLLSSYTTSIIKMQEVIKLSSYLLPNVQQFLYLPDLDTKGMQKADLFQKAMWGINIPCKIFDLRAKLVKSTNFVRGYDIADYIIENNDINLVEVFENEF